MYKKTRHKRRRIKVLQFFELIMLPLFISGLILMLMLWIVIDPLGIRFSSPVQMIVILLAIILFIGGIIFEFSRVIIKRILHYSTLDFFEKMFEKLFKR